MSVNYLWHVVMIHSNKLLLLVFAVETGEESVAN
jgi:hypothetical protein